MMFRPDMQDYLATQSAGNPEAPTPIQSGAQHALDMARRSMQMNPLQARRASGRAISEFAANMGTPEPGTGFAGALGAFSKGFGPASKAYDESRQQAENQNVALMNYLENQRRQALNERRQEAQAQALGQRHEEQMQLQRERLAEMARYHDMTGQRGNKAQQETPSTGNPYIDDLPVIEKGERKDIVRRKTSTSSLLSEIENIESTLAEFEKETEGSAIDPFNPYFGTYANAAKDFAGTFGNQQFAKQRTLRKQLDAALRQFNITIERQLKGGVVSEGMAKRFENKGVLPSTNEPLPDLRAKLDDLKHHIKLENDAAQLSMKFGRHVSASDLHNLLTPSASADSSMMPPGTAPQVMEAPFSLQDIDAELARRGAL